MQKRTKTTALRVGIIGGCGWLGRALSDSVLRAGFIDASRLMLSKREGPVTALPGCPTVEITTDNRALIERSHVILLSVRPQDFSTVEFNLQGKLVVSVMAAVSIDTIRRRTRAERIVRAMPNAAAEIGRSYTPWFANTQATDSDRALVQALFETCGTSEEVARESHIDYLTALTGSGPAFPALLADAMLNHAVSNGLPLDVATRAVTVMLTGAAQLIAANDSQPRDMVDRFLNYGGATAAGLQAMMDGGFADAVHAGINAAAAAATESSGSYL